MKNALKKVLTLLIAASLCGCAGSKESVTESNSSAGSSSSSDIAASSGNTVGSSAGSSSAESSAGNSSSDANSGDEESGASGGVNSNGMWSGSSSSANSSSAGNNSLSAAGSGSSSSSSGAISSSSSSHQSSSSAVIERPDTPESAAGLSPKVFPRELEEIPSGYYNVARQQGTLVDLNYSTYESFSYEQKTQTLQKHAVVYLPYGYDESKQYNVFYLMHGGWSNENTSLGTPSRPSSMKNVLDNAIADGKIDPLIVVCPTYNNTSGEDSGDYSLALRLTRNYHNELINDLIPAVEGKYSTYAESTSDKDLKASRDHRAFCGFSMGSVTTWHTFEYCLDYFRYFALSSGSFSQDGEYWDNVVKNSGHSWNDFFIITITGTEDFAESAFTRQIENIQDYDSFRYSDTEKDGNLTFRLKEGYSHNGIASMEYAYNALRWFWNANP